MLHGIGENVFGPDAFITRQDMSVMLYRTLQASNINVDGNLEWKHDFLDIEDVVSYAEDALKYFNNLGIINGISESEIAPRKNATKEQAIVIIKRTYDIFDNKSE